MPGMSELILLYLGRNISDFISVAVAEVAEVTPVAEGPAEPIKGLVFHNDSHL